MNKSENASQNSWLSNASGTLSLKTYTLARHRTRRVGDYTDVKVVSPYERNSRGAELSRLSDEEMKLRMIEVVNKTYSFLTVLFNSSRRTIDKFLTGLQS